MEKKKVIIIGGGFAGSYLAKRLEKKFNIVLIDIKDYFEFTPGILKAIINPKYAEKIKVSHKNYLKKSKIIIDEVLEVNEKNVKTKNEKYDYDHLIICSGSKYHSPIKNNNSIIIRQSKNLIKYSLKLKNSEKVLIIGGGLVGVELAGEICSIYKNKEIILIDSENRLIKRNKIKSSIYAQKFLEKKGVKFIFNEKIISRKGNVYVTDKGNEIKPDLSFLCTGIKPNSNFMKKNFRKCIDKKGYLMVNKNLQLIENKNIFVAGDVNNVSQEKTAQNTRIQAKLIVKNIKLIEKKKKLLEYVPKKTPLVISLGEKKGVFEYKNYVLKGKIPSIMKKIIEKKIIKELKATNI